MRRFSRIVACASSNLLLAAITSGQQTGSTTAPGEQWKNQMNPFCKLFCMLSACVVVAALCPASLPAQTYIYANNLSINGPCAGGYIYKINALNGQVVHTYSQLELGSVCDGRGVAVVGDYMYYTDGETNNVYKYNLMTGKYIGVDITVNGTSYGLASLTSDGTYLWIQDYPLSNTVHVYDTLLSG